MMKKKRTYFLLIALWAVSSCNKDDGNDCDGSTGELSAQVHEDFTFTSRSVSFYALENRPDEVEIIAWEATDNCILLGSLGFFFEKTTGPRELIKGNTGEVNSTHFAEFDDDVVLGNWDLYEAEPRTATLTRVDDDIIEGRFTATYVYREPSYKTTTLPDTLRFKDVYFKAEFFDRNQ